MCAAAVPAESWREMMAEQIKRDAAKLMKLWPANGPEPVPEPARERELVAV